MKKLKLFFLMAALCASAPSWASESDDGSTSSSSLGLEPPEEDKEARRQWYGRKARQHKLLADKAEKAGDLQAAKSELMASMACYNMAFYGRSYVWKN